jgi:hypothetical protein
LDRKTQEFNDLKDNFDNLKNEVEKVKELVNVYKEELVEILAIYEEKMNDISKK